MKEAQSWKRGTEEIKEEKKLVLIKKIKNNCTERYECIISKKK